MRVKPGLCMCWGNTPNTQVIYELKHSVALRVLYVLFTEPLRQQLLLPGKVGIWYYSPSGGAEKSHPEKQNTKVLRKPLGYREVEKYKDLPEDLEHPNCCQYLLEVSQ